MARNWGDAFFHNEAAFRALRGTRSGLARRWLGDFVFWRRLDSMRSLGDFIRQKTTRQSLGLTRRLRLAEIARFVRGIALRF